MGWENKNRRKKKEKKGVIVVWLTDGAWQHNNQYIDRLSREGVGRDETRIICMIRVEYNFLRTDEYVRAGLLDSACIHHCPAATTPYPGV